VLLRFWMRPLGYSSDLVDGKIIQRLTILQLLFICVICYTLNLSLPRLNYCILLVNNSLVASTQRNLQFTCIYRRLNLQELSEPIYSILFRDK
jgi:hypothetical protein